MVAGLMVDVELLATTQYLAVSHQLGVALALILVVQAVVMEVQAEALPTPFRQLVGLE